MWLRKQDGELVNLHHAQAIEVRNLPKTDSRPETYAVSTHHRIIKNYAKGGVANFGASYRNLFKSPSKQECDRVLMLIASNIAKGTVVMDLGKLPAKGGAE